MFKPWKLSLFFLLCLLASLLANTPAALVLPYLQLPPSLRLIGTHGSIVRGRIDLVEFEALALQHVEFHLQAQCLLGLEVCYWLDSDDARLQYAYALLSGDATISDARLQLPADFLSAYTPALPLRLTGQIELELAKLTLVRGLPTSLNGQLVWRGLGADEGNNPLLLGDYRALINGDGKQYRAELGTLDASLRIDGDASLQQDGQFKVDLAIGSEEAIDPRAKALLELFARNSGYNQYRVQRQGQLSPGQLGQLFPQP